MSRGAPDSSTLRFYSDRQLLVSDSQVEGAKELPDIQRIALAIRGKRSGLIARSLGDPLLGDPARAPCKSRVWAILSEVREFVPEITRSSGHFLFCFLIRCSSPVKGSEVSSIQTFAGRHHLAQAGPSSAMALASYPADSVGVRISLQRPFTP